MKTLLTTAALAIAGMVTVQAADIAPVTGHLLKFGERFSALVYYIDKPDGFHVVVTTQQGARDKAAVERFETVLAVLDVLLANGIEIPMSCEQGVCGTCVTGVLHGVPDHRDMFMTDEEHARNDQFTPCCSRAKSDLLVLDL
jgi:ferredoxin